MEERKSGGEAGVPEEKIGRDAAVLLLKTYYRQYYDDIAEEVVIGKLKLQDVISSLAVVKKDLAKPEFVFPFSFPELLIDNRLIIHDCSGVGLATVSFFLTALWGGGRNANLDQYEYVILLSIKQLRHLKGSANIHEIIVRMLKTYIGRDVDIAGIDVDKILFIIDGFDDFFLNRRNSEKLIADVAEIIPFVTSQKNVLIFSSGEHAPPFNEYRVYNMGLMAPPVSVEYTRHIPRETVKRKFYSKQIYHRAIQALDRAFATISRGYEGTIQDSATSLHQQLSSHFFHGTPVNAVKRTVSHNIKLITASEILRFLLDGNHGNDTVKLLKCPADWFAAATTTVEDADKTKFFTYNVGGYLVIMTAHDHYVSVIGKVSEIKVNLMEELSSEPDAIDPELTAIINSLKALAVNDDAVLLKLGTILGKPEYKNKFKVLCRLLKNIMRFSDPQKSNTKTFQSGLSEYADHTDRVDRADYRTLQLYLNHAMTTSNDLMQILDGDDALDSNVAEILAAILLSEVSRYKYAFLSTLCYFDLAASDDPANVTYAMSRGLCHPRSTIESAEKKANLADATLAMKLDCFDAIGGFLPLCHDNSFNQLSKLLPVAHPYLTHWVEFKSIVIISDWLTLQANHNPQSGFVKLIDARSDPEDCPLANEDDLEYVITIVYEYYNQVTQRLRGFQLMPNSFLCLEPQLERKTLDQLKEEFEVTSAPPMGDLSATTSPKPHHKSYIVYGVSADALNLKAMQHYADDRPDEALKVLNSILVKDPAFYSSLRYRALILFNIGKYQFALEDSIKLLSEASASSEDVRDFTILVAKCRFCLNEFALAIQILEDYLSHCEIPDAYVLYLLIHCSNKDFREKSQYVPWKIESIEKIISDIDLCIMYGDQLNPMQRENLKTLLESLTAELEQLKNSQGAISALTPDK